MMRAWLSRSGRRLVSFIALSCLVSPLRVYAQLAPCAHQNDGRRITEAIDRIEHSVDPCGESAQIAALLKQLEHCTATAYRVCTSLEIDRNVFDRPLGAPGESMVRTIFWNPELRSELEPSCDGDRSKPVLRDPTASLLHELAHAVQDCSGLNPGDHELEAVAIENIYRRAAGLCQRTSYGEEILPASMTKLCNADKCTCATPRDTRGMQLVDVGNGEPPPASAGGVTTTQVGDDTSLR